MHLIVKVNKSATTTPEWETIETWPDAERIPGKDELFRLKNAREMRVVEVSQDGPSTVEIYLVETYVRVQR